MAATLLKHAKAALFRAKVQGGNKHQFYDPYMVRAVDDLNLAACLPNVRPRRARSSNDMAQWPRRCWRRPPHPRHTPWDCIGHESSAGISPRALAGWLANMSSALPLQFGRVVMAGRASLTAFFPAIPNLSGLLGRLQCEGATG